MDPTIPSLSRAWWIYVAAVGVSAGALIAAGERSVSPRFSRVADLSASHGGSISELSKSKEWMVQVKFFNKNFLGPESGEWRNSPASEVLSGEMAIPQAQSNRLAKLWITGPAETITGNGSYYLRVDARRISRGFSVPANAVIGPILRDNNPIALQLVEGIFFKTDKASAVSIAPSSLEFDKPATLDLLVPEANRREIGHDRLHVGLQLIKVDPNQATVDDRSEAPGDASDIENKALKGKVAFDELAITDNRMITPAGRYTTLILTGDKDPRKYVRCIRTDTNQQVGAYSDRFPIVAVAVNGWASVKMQVSAHDFGEEFSYRIISLSGDDVTTKALLLWFVTHDLTTKEVEGRVLALPEIDARAAWLEEVLGVQFSEEEVQNIQNPEVRRVVDHLWSLQTTKGQLP